MEALFLLTEVEVLGKFNVSNIHFPRSFIDTMSKLITILQILTLKEKKRAFKLLAFIFIGMFLEVLGVGLIIPVMLFIVQPDVILQYSEQYSSLKILGSLTQIQLVVNGMMFLLAVYFFKAWFLTYMNMVQSRFIYDVQASLSLRFFKGYMYKSYTDHLQRNSSKLIRNTMNEVSSFVGVMNSAAIVVTETVVLIGLFLMLSIVNPVGVLFITLFSFLIGFIYYRVTKDSLLDWGNKRQLNDGMRIQHLQQGFHSLKDIKILGREKYFIDQYSINNSESADMTRKITFMNAIPRLWLEFLSVFALVVLILVMVNSVKDFRLLIPVIGVFAGAAVRLMPSAHRIMVNIQNLRYSMPVINLLYSEIKTFNESNRVTPNTHEIDYKKTISINKVRYTYLGSSKKILNNVCIKIPFGSITGFIGESGSGKTTLIDIILGLLEPTSGSVNIGDTNIQSNLQMWHKNIGYVPQDIYLTDDTLRNNIAYGIERKLIDDSQIIKVMSMVQLTKFLSTQSKGLNTMIGEHGSKLSGGQRQRIGIARALYHNPKILILDEATSALDIETEKELMKIIHSLRGNITIVIVTHKISITSNCDQVYKVKGGNVFT